MPEPVSIAVSCWIGFQALNASSRTRSAFSPTAYDLADEVATILKATETSQVLFGRTSAILSMIEEMAEECATQDWDGYGARPVDQDAVINAEAFVRALPDEVPMPEIAADPDGSVSLDWIESRHRMFTVSIPAGNRIAYAWLDGAEKGHAVAVFDGLSIPIKVRDGILSIVGHANAAIRTV